MTAKPELCNECSKRFNDKEELKNHKCHPQKPHTHFSDRKLTPSPNYMSPKVTTTTTATTTTNSTDYHLNKKRRHHDDSNAITPSNVHAGTKKLKLGTATKALFRGNNHQ